MSASSGSLAFTGPGSEVKWVVLVGAALVIMGLAMLVLVDAPRRMVRALALRTGRHMDSPTGPPSDLWHHGG